MINQFNSLPWHDAKLLEININRSNPGRKDIVTMEIKWPNSIKNKIIFNDCYFFNAQMNFGVISEENILSAECFEENEVLSKLKVKWRSLGVDLNRIICFQVITNSTNSKIDIYALSFILL